jgi:hypothetical protein
MRADSINFRLRFTELSARITKMMFDLSIDQPAWNLRNGNGANSVKPVMGDPMWGIHEN